MNKLYLIDEEDIKEIIRETLHQSHNQAKTLYERPPSNEGWAFERALQRTLLRLSNREAFPVEAEA